MKIAIILSLSLLSAACNATDNTSMKNGYKYENWGNNFISITTNGETRQAIEGQVDSYLVNGKSLIAKQKDLISENLTYWIIDMSTHEKVKFSDSHAFLKNATLLGFDLEKTKALISS